MKTTVDIPDGELKDAIRYSKAKTKRDAIVTAVAEYNRRQRMAELTKYSGVSDTLMSNDDIEALDAQAWQSRGRKARRRGRRS
jgi:hypothetical protein